MIINNFKFALLNQGSTSKNNAINNTKEKKIPVDCAPQSPGDSADISVTAKMTSQLNGLHQALQNINKGYSFVTIADGSLVQTQDILQKIRTIGVKAANGTYTSSDRQMFQVEVSALVDEVNRIASQAQYNRFLLFTGSFSKSNPRASMWFQIGPNMDNRERVYIGTMTAFSLGLKSMNGHIVNVSTPSGGNRVIGIIDSALQRVAKQRADLFGYSQRLKTAAKGTIIKMEKILQTENVYSNKDVIKSDIEVVKKRMRIK